MYKNAIWITGASGSMGTALKRLLKQKPGCKIIATDRDVDITDMEAVAQAAEIYRPSVVINCASIWDPEYCRQNMVEAFRVNGLGARNLASVSRRYNAKMIQISTDDVFDGMKTGRFTEFDPPNPKTVYGRSKLAGENYVRELNPKHLIIRSSWVYGAGKEDYLSEVLRLGMRQEHFTAPIDQVSTPTSAGTLADLIASILEKSEYGIFHASCEGMCSRYDFAKEILHLAGYETSLVQGTVSESGRNASSTLLENLMLKMTGLYEMPMWKEDLCAYMERAGEEKRK